MPPITITAVHSGTEIFAAWATFTVAVAAVAGLGLSVWLPHRERQAAREQGRTELLRQQRVAELREIAQQYALYRATSRREQAKALAKLRAVLWLMPDGMAARLKSQFDVPLGPKDKELLAASYGGGVPHAFTEAAVITELRDNNLHAGWGVPEPTKTHRRRFCRHPREG